MDAAVLIQPARRVAKRVRLDRKHRDLGRLFLQLDQAEDHVLQTMAVYIDLNCVRAGLVTDPKEYRFCGYAEAVAGNEAAQIGFRSVVGGSAWDVVQAHFRALIFGTGADACEAAATIKVEDLHRVIAEGGTLPLATILRCRLRYFTDGAVLGSRAFVEVQLAKYRNKTGRREGTRPRELPAWANWGDLATLRGLRRRG